MKQHFILVVCVVLLAGCGNGQSHKNSDGQSRAGNSQQPNHSNPSGGTPKNNKNSKFSSKQAKQSYALGMNIGHSLQKMPIKVNTDELASGINDQLGSGKTRLTQKQVRNEMAQLVKQMRSSQNKKHQQRAARNLKKSKMFLTKNKTKKGFKTTADGLQYKVLKKGSGPSPEVDDNVTVSYVGKLPNGKVFDSTKQHGKPANFSVAAVIPGLTEALQLMHTGAKYKLVIPPKLAYGKHGAGNVIGPNQVLIFKVTLEKITSGQNKAKNSGRNSSNSTSSRQSSESSQ